MLKEAPGPINFTVFLTMFGEKLKGEPGVLYSPEHDYTLSCQFIWNIMTKSNAVCGPAVNLSR